MSNIENLVVGIDLGTTFTCVAVFQNGKVDIIENRSGKKITPSVVTINENETIVGRVSKIYELNTVYEVKRLIGRKYDEDILKQDYKNWTFKVENVDSLPMIKLKEKGRDVLYHPEQISAKVLNKMKEIASLRLHQDIKNVVITVPAYFNDSQRQATIDAAKIAGLNCLRIINEPTAAAIAYYYDKQITNNKKILVFDLGGGTFDVSIVSIENNPADLFKVIAIGGDTHLGGVDFTNRMVDYFLDLYNCKFDADLSSDKRAIHRLRLACEKAKIELSDCLEYTLEIDAFQNGNNFVERMSRALLEDINDDLFRKTIDILNNTIREAGLSKENIDEVILIGGSTRIPKIKELLVEYFNGVDKLRQTLNPDEAVAYGAALKAAMLSDTQNKDLPDLQFIDATPLSLGVTVRESEMSFIVKRNTNIPCSVTKEYTTLYDSQKSILFRIYEGERLLVEENIRLGEFTLDKIETAPAGVPRIDVTFSIDSNGILHASALDRKTLTKNEIVISRTKGQLNEEKIRKLIIAAKRKEQDDKKRLEILTAKNELEVFIFNKKHAGVPIDEFQATLDWLHNTQNFSVYELRDKLSILKIEVLNYEIQRN